ncbi:MAG: hypothetical protein KatS3mg131_1158 [Candidatus Tectimicrobiota bacterium]|nr:MAG: hypothetical protein KatS3mg131_1158 [Candidatus Tectomicrobia bacterium]
MGTPRLPALVQPFCAVLLAPSLPASEVEAALCDLFGPLLLRSPAFPFTHTAYYTREMGPDLQRFFVAFAPLIAMSDLVWYKHRTNRLEACWAGAGGQRRANLDPGYLSLAKVVLASTKDHAHRLYLGAGIYAEVTLSYRQRRYRPWPWTYPDYRLPVTLAFFHRLRERYRQRLRQPGGGS